MDIVIHPLTFQTPLLLIVLAIVFLAMAPFVGSAKGTARTCAAAFLLLCLGSGAAGGSLQNAYGQGAFLHGGSVLSALLGGVGSVLLASGIAFLVTGVYADPSLALRRLRGVTGLSLRTLGPVFLVVGLVAGLLSAVLPPVGVSYAVAAVTGAGVALLSQRLLMTDRVHSGSASGRIAPMAAVLPVLWAGVAVGLGLLSQGPGVLGQGLWLLSAPLLPLTGLLVLFRRVRQEQEAAVGALARLEAAVQESGQIADRWRHQLASLPEALLVTDQAGVVQDANPRAVALLTGAGAGADPVVGRPVQSLLTGDDGTRPEWGSLLADGTRTADLAISPPHGGPRTPVRAVISRTEQDGQAFCLILLQGLAEERRSGAMNEFLHELDRTAIAGGNPEDLQQALCHQICGLFGLGLTVIVVPDRQGHTVVRGVSGTGVTAEAMTAVLARSDWNNGVLQDVIRMGGRLLLTVDDSPLPTALPVPQDWLVVLPLWGQTDVIGCLMVAGTGLAPDQRSLKQMDTVSARLGNALQVMQDQTQMRLQGMALAAAANAIFITDVSGRIEWVNAAFTRLSGYEAHEVLGKTPALLRSGMQDDDSYRRFWDTIKSGRVWRGEMVERRKDGSLYTVDQTVAPIRDERDRIAHFVTVHEDITERKRAEERIAYLSNYDTLTRLPNRVLFRDHLYQAVNQARNNRTSLAVLFVDLDRFSRVNDTLGHDVGDQLLMTIASRINAVAAPEADTIARIGGDEFALIQNRLTSTEAAASLARKVIDAVNRPVDISGLEVRVGTNVGIAIYPQDGEDPDHLIKNADMAMYRAVRSESEKCFFYSNEMNDEARVRLALEGDLRRALDNGDLCLNFQPQVDVRSRRIIGVEALLRWKHPEHGMIPPSRFIPVAEDSGLILPIGDWVIQEAVRQSRAWQDEGLPPITVAINISAVQFQQGNLVRRVGDAISDSGIDPSCFELELTESMLMQDANEAIRTLEDLSGLGAKLAIDDFGTGYSSLSYLKQFPVDRLKLDQSFVRQMTTNHSDAVIARATINLGHSLGLEVIAEGVETEDQYEYLRAEGCDVVQGYLFGKPMAPSDLAAVLRYSGPGGSIAAGRVPEGMISGLLQ